MRDSRSRASPGPASGWTGSSDHLAEGAPGLPLVPGPGGPGRLGPALRWGFGAWARLRRHGAVVYPRDLLRQHERYILHGIPVAGVPPAVYLPVLAGLPAGLANLHGQKLHGLPEISVGVVQLALHLRQDHLLLLLVAEVHRSFRGELVQDAVAGEAPCAEEDALLASVLRREPRQRLLDHKQVTLVRLRVQPRHLRPHRCHPSRHRNELILEFLERVTHVRRLGLGSHIPAHVLEAFCCPLPHVHGLRSCFLPQVPDCVLQFVHTVERCLDLREGRVGLGELGEHLSIDLLDVLDLLRDHLHLRPRHLLLVQPNNGDQVLLPLLLQLLDARDEASAGGGGVGRRLAQLLDHLPGVHELVTQAAAELLICGQLLRYRRVLLRHQCL
mmetsp:Transcript_54412/g.145320  ORF Transcript_54412/g.145320 Transcript_54412/m.145320 type:complete len:386 (+) Transcript_54412:446-1603(+)